MDPRPVAFGLQVHPNPSNTGPAFRWQIIEEAVYDVSVYDILGRKVETLRQEVMPVGFYIQRTKRELASGVYFAVISKYNDRRVVKFAVLR
ncbi:MAG: T9SS type A sorting domain-containing protein [candidate division Zixibacteria bacterium]|nr:T9SS type A sorting domain-containing protein [candidate division Zixibacteria bacterium]